MHLNLPGISDRFSYIVLADNFHLYNNGPIRILQVFSNSKKKFTLAPTAGSCNQGFSVGSIGSLVYVTPSSSGVTLHVEDSSGDKYYLRINTAQNYAVELVCQSYVDSVSLELLTSLALR